MPTTFRSGINLLCYVNYLVTCEDRLTEATDKNTQAIMRSDEDLLGVLEQYMSRNNY